MSNPSNAFIHIPRLFSFIKMRRSTCSNSSFPSAFSAFQSCLATTLPLRRPLPVALLSSAHVIPPAKYKHRHAALESKLSQRIYEKQTLNYKYGTLPLLIHPSAMVKKKHLDTDMPLLSSAIKKHVRQYFNDFSLM